MDSQPFESISRQHPRHFQHVMDAEDGSSAPIGWRGEKKFVFVVQNKLVVLTYVHEDDS
jgi:hypothetical protein